MKYQACRKAERVKAPTPDPQPRGLRVRVRCSVRLVCLASSCNPCYSEADQKPEHIDFSLNCILNLAWTPCRNLI